MLDKRGPGWEVFDLTTDSSGETIDQKNVEIFAHGHDIGQGMYLSSIETADIVTEYLKDGQYARSTVELNIELQVNLLSYHVMGINNHATF